ncbi:uncharacterized protein SCHCODRAFT_02590302 [Schizophyllum commune H4-8]|nr:uncharacterized protein SCHCODRAFT_02590302 [Schizophyllum commune H4-8]KAI5886903.1 hypothetical protein SCHCODRAFT_02590302 [Schizophyllum commune H4-8]
MQRRAPQARGDGGASSALRWALHPHAVLHPLDGCAPGNQTAHANPPPAPSTTRLAPPPIDAAPHLRRCPHRAKNARAQRQRSHEMLSDCAACALTTLQTIRALMIFHSPGFFGSIDGSLKIGMTHLSRTSLRLAVTFTTGGLAVYTTFARSPDVARALAPEKAEFAIVLEYLRGLLEWTKLVLFANATAVQYRPQFLLNGQRRHHLSRCRILSQSSATSMAFCGSN